MTEQRPVSTTRVVRDVAAVICIVAAIGMLNVVAWWIGVRAGLLVTALDLGGLGVVLGSSR